MSFNVVRAVGGDWVRDVKEAHNSCIVTNLVKKVHSIDVDWKDFSGLNSLKIYQGQLGRHYSASGFWNASSDKFYDAIVDSKYYIKYDIEKGRLLFGDITNYKRSIRVLFGRS